MVYLAWFSISFFNPLSDLQLQLQISGGFSPRPSATHAYLLPPYPQFFGNSSIMKNVLILKLCLKFSILFNLISIWLFHVWEHLESKSFQKKLQEGPAVSITLMEIISAMKVLQLLLAQQAIDYFCKKGASDKFYRVSTH